MANNNPGAEGLNIRINKPPKIKTALKELRQNIARVNAERDRLSSYQKNAEKEYKQIRVINMRIMDKYAHTLKAKEELLRRIAESDAVKLRLERVKRREHTYDWRDRQTFTNLRHQHIMHEIECTFFRRVLDNAGAEANKQHISTIRELEVLGRGNQKVLEVLMACCNDKNGGIFVRRG